MPPRTPSAWLVACCLAGLSCATGMPVGARGSLFAYEPFAGPASVAEVASSSEDPEPTPLNAPPDARDRTVAAARRLMGQSRVVLDGRRFGDDCTGLVRAAYASVGIDLMSAGRPGDNGVTAIWRFAARHGRHYAGGRPVEGDLVFYRDTYDLNRDGRFNDGLTHIGLVEHVGDDDTVTLIHRTARGVVRTKMNLSAPDVARSSDGRQLNEYLRTPGPGHAPQLTSRLFAGYATLLPLESRFARR